VGQRRDIKRHDRDGGEEWRSSPRSQQIICGCNDADELGELVHVVGSAHRRKHAGQVIDVAPYPVVRIEECLHVLSIVFV